ncbi:hypothetical protein A2U01_0076702, partial [Trifolium medium]|nr:hypothetical protein [Trifolium medium]
MLSQPPRLRGWWRLKMQCTVALLQRLTGGFKYMEGRNTEE